MIANATEIADVIADGALPVAKTVPAPGIYYDIPAKEYFGWDAVNASTLKRMAQSAAHCQWEKDNPKEATPAMIVGSCTHAATLEPAELTRRYLVADNCSSIKGSGGTCTNAGKILSGGIWYCGVHGKNRILDTISSALGEDGELIESAIVTIDQMHKAQAMAISVRRNRAARELLDASRKEVCVVWVDPVTQMLCKARFDAYDGQRIPDLKTCEDASPEEFSRQIGDMGYDIQAAFYVDAATSIEGELHEQFYFIAVEKSAPFVCAVYKAHAELLALGRHRYRRLLADYKWCIENNMWPGYHDHQIEPIGCTKYFFDKESKK